MASESKRGFRKEITVKRNPIEIIGPAQVVREIVSLEPAPRGGSIVDVMLGFARAPLLLPLPLERRGIENQAARLRPVA